MTGLSFLKQYINTGVVYRSTQCNVINIHNWSCIIIESPSYFKYNENSLKS